jgi:hypothetical protein
LFGSILLGEGGEEEEKGEKGESFNLRYLTSSR